MNEIGIRAATIEDIAAECRLTKMTVSRALTGKGAVASDTRRRVLQTAERLKYEPNLHARSLSKGQSDLILLFSPVTLPGVHFQTVERMQILLKSHGYEVPYYGFLALHFSEPAEQAKKLRAVRELRPRAIVCRTVELRDSALREMERYVELGGILVCYGHPTESPIDQVVIDYEGMAYQSASHLLELGHRDIGFFSAGLHWWWDRRLAGFSRALREKGMEVREEWLFDGPSYEAGGELLAERFLALPQRPTGMVVVNDVAAGAFISTISRAGVRVPGDVSVVGHDDAPCARFCQPALTTIRHPVETIAQNVVAMLLERLDGIAVGAPRRQIAQGELVVRESSDAPKNCRLTIRGDYNA